MATDIAFSYAPGKIILIGEHAVVYGAKALALPLDHGVRVAVSSLSAEAASAGPMIRGIGPFFMGETFVHQENCAPKVLINALEYLAEAFGNKARDMAIVVDGSLPPGRGLGSSAALSVALIRAIYRYLGHELRAISLEKHVLALETIFHGQPSGIDQAVVASGQALAFKRKEDIRYQVPIVINRDLSFVIAFAGPHDGTKNAVKELADRKKRQEKAYTRIFANLDDMANDMEEALREGRLACVGELMNIAQGYLNALSLSTPQIENLCAIARERGALGAKLTGAGGGGAVIALCDGCEKGLAGAFKAAGYQSFITKVAARPQTEKAHV
jgi:hydroxymethylglutaryl-CoA reductase